MFVGGERVVSARAFQGRNRVRERARQKAGLRPWLCTMRLFLTRTYVDKLTLSERLADCVESRGASFFSANRLSAKSLSICRLKELNILISS